MSEVNSQPLVSVITPTYNHERFIATCISSVVDQTYSNWEQIVIDDGSDDATARIVRNFNDSRIHPVFQKHKGIWRLGEAYNTALEMAQGELIAILEGDDFWPANKLKKEVPYFEDNNVILVWSKAGLSDAQGRVMEIVPHVNLRKDKNIWENRPPGNFLKKLLLTNPIPTATVLIRKTALDKIGGFLQPKFLPLVDYPTFLELTLHGEFRVSNEIFGYYRRYLGQATLANANIGRDCARYNLSFFFRLSQEVKKRINIRETELKQNFQAASIYSYWIGARVCLSNKQWRHARRQLRKVMKDGNLKLKIKGLVGYMMSLFHLDFEVLVKLFGKTQFR